jgi:glycosyltransferase involved in cell wall biosynthesis
VRVAFDWGPLLDPPTGVGRYTRELAASLELLGTDLTRYAVAWGGGRGTKGGGGEQTSGGRETRGGGGKQTSGRPGPTGEGFEGTGEGRREEGTNGPGRGGPAEGVVRWRMPARLVQAAWRYAGAPSIERLTGPVDLVHATNFVLPALGRAPGVVTVHDLSYLRADTFPGGHRLRELVPWSLRRASVVLVPTRAVADELTERYGSSVGRVEVAHEGVSARFFGARPLSDVVLGRMGIPGPFVVAVGTLEPRKNLARFLKAWEAASDFLDGWTLALAGPKGWGPDLPRAANVVPLGWVGDETLPGLLAAAELFCYPSLYEGFGLPPLEAMAAGTPALVGRYRCADEVLGDAAELVEPTDVEALREGLIGLIDDAAKRQRLARAGRARALAYTWERTAATTMNTYRGALGIS